MDKTAYINAANTETFTEIRGEATGRRYSVRNNTYGVLVPDVNHPLSAVSVANSSLSIDLWKGCALQCSYCHVQGTLTDLGEDLKMPRRPEHRVPFSIDEIVEALTQHPFFQRDISVISIGTASTEPFVVDPVTESTFAVMDAFANRGFRNPFWIVTKMGIPKGCRERLERIMATSRGVLVSICWADNPINIEPARHNRFAHCAEAYDTGVSISWYLRPLVPEWSGTPENLEMMMLWVQAHYGAFLSSIVPGGLRWTEGIEYGLVEVHRQPMPNIPRTDNIKALPEELWQHIMTLGSRLFPKVPIYRRSSCALTHLLGCPSITSIQTLHNDDCGQSICPASQRQVCAGSGRLRLDTTNGQAVLDNLGIPARVHAVNNHRLITEPPLTDFTYTIQQTVEKALAVIRPEVPGG